MQWADNLGSYQSASEFWASLFSDLQATAFNLGYDAYLTLLSLANGYTSPIDMITTLYDEHYNEMACLIYNQSDPTLAAAEWMGYLEANVWATFTLPVRTALLQIASYVPLEAMFVDPESLTVPASFQNRDCSQCEGIEDVPIVTGNYSVVPIGIDYYSFTTLPSFLSWNGNTFTMSDTSDHGGHSLVFDLYTGAGSIVGIGAKIESAFANTSPLDIEFIPKTSSPGKWAGSNLDRGSFNENSDGEWWLHFDLEADRDAIVAKFNELGLTLTTGLSFNPTNSQPYGFSWKNDAGQVGTLVVSTYLVIKA
jgi:hypothetical protein